MPRLPGADFSKIRPFILAHVAARLGDAVGIQAGAVVFGFYAVAQIRNAP